MVLVYGARQRFHDITLRETSEPKDRHSCLLFALLGTPIADRPGLSRR
jgi:hypothetical protein